MLIGTKLIVPPIKSKVVARPRLINHLSEGKESRLIVISGMAGCGKTSLVCEWARHDDLPVVWYSLDENDNDIDLFLRYLLTALCNVDKVLAAVAKTFLQEQTRLSGTETIPLLVKHLIDVPHDVYIVFDDYHVISLEEIHQALKHLLDYAPPNLHIVLVSRYSVPFSLSHFRVHGQVVEISASDMKFTEKETEQFFREILHVTLSLGQIQELARRMEGWVGGLQLFGLAAKKKKIVSDLTGLLSKTYDGIADYLIDEVISSQPEKMQIFLQATALLSRFNADLAREVTGLSDARQMLDQAIRKNLFLNVLDREKKWYRYHNLFAKAMREKHVSSLVGGKKEVYRIAARWCAQNGYLEDAFRHAFSSDDFEFAASMLEDYLMVLYDRYEIASFRRWLSKVPYRILTQHPLLRLYECRFRLESVRLAEAVAIVADIESRKQETFKRYEQAKRKRCKDLLLLSRHILRYWTDVTNINVEEVEEILNHMSPEDKGFSAIVRVMSLSSHIHRGNMRLAGEALRDVSSAVFSSGNLLAKMIWFQTVAKTEMFQGRLSQAEAVVREGFLFLDRSNLSGSPLRPMLHLAMAWICYMRNDLARAMEYALTTLKYAEQTRFVYEINDGNYLLALIYLAGGETEKAEQCARRMQWAAREIGQPSFLALTDAYVAYIFLAKGDLKWAQRWAEQRGLVMDESFSFHFVVECTVQGELFCHQGRYEEAVHMLQVLRSRCMEHNMLEMTLYIDILSVAALYGLGEHLRAKIVLELAISFSESEGYLRPFIDHAEAISPVLTEIASTSHKSSYAVTIAKACAISRGGAAMTGRQRKSGVEEITPREKEILELMAAGLRNKEIADTLFVSPLTIKTHSKNLFRKLAAKTRIQAIQRAKDLKIL